VCAVLTVLLVLGLAGTLTITKRRTGLMITPVTLFFSFATVHAISGRYTAFLTARFTFVNEGTLEPFVNQSFCIISVGLICCFVTYMLVPFYPSGMANLLGRMASPGIDQQIRTRSIILIAIAIPLIVVGLQQLGGIPLLSGNIRQDRYLQNFLPEYRFDNFMVNRGREMIVIPSVALAMRWFAGRRSVVDALFVLIAFVSCLLTAIRSPILTGVLIGLVLLIWRRRAGKVAVTVAAISMGLIASEVGLGDADPRATQVPMLERIGADFVEVRDLGWILMKQDERQLGTTFLAGLLPIPSFASDFTEEHHLRTVTLRAVGIPLTAAHGGLRITISGEWFINFGWAGVIVGGLIFGWMCSRFTRMFHVLRKSPEAYPVGALVLACAWVSFSFMVYLSGSAVGGTLKTYAAVILALSLRLRRTERLGQFAFATLRGAALAHENRSL